MTPEERADEKLEFLDHGKSSGALLLSKNEYVKHMADAIRAAVAEEREACVQTLVDVDVEDWENGVQLCDLFIAAIEKRGSQ